MLPQDINPKKNEASHNRLNNAKKAQLPENLTGIIILPDERLIKVNGGRRRMPLID